MSFRKERIGLKNLCVKVPKRGCTGCTQTTDSESEGCKRNITGIKYKYAPAHATPCNFPPDSEATFLG